MESMKEWHAELWLAFIDFEKAFDTVKHDQLWIAMSEQGIPEEYITITQRLYVKQKMQIKVEDKSSRMFEVQKGVKQGDPISALLFICVLNKAIKAAKERWGRANRMRRQSMMGIVIDDTENPLSNLRFADDIVLISQSREDAIKVLYDVQHEAAKLGLRLHAGKTKIVTNGHRMGCNKA